MHFKYDLVETSMKRGPLSVYWRVNRKNIFCEAHDNHNEEHA